MHQVPLCNTTASIAAPRIAVGELYVGLNSAIPLWYQNKVVHLAVYAQGWPTGSHGKYAAVQLYRAAQAWNRGAD